MHFANRRVLPDDVRQSNQERDCSGDPERFCGQQPPIRTHQQSHYKCAEEEQCRVLCLDWALGAV